MRPDRGDRRVWQAFPSSPRRGMGLILIVGLIAFLGTLAASLVHLSLVKYQQGARLRDAVALEHLLQGGLARARAELRRSPDYAGAERLPLGPGEVRIVVEAGDRNRRIVVTAAVPDFAKPRRVENVGRDWPLERPPSRRR